MAERVGIEVSLAVSEAVKLAEVDVISAYPITPQTHIVEELSQIVADGELDADFIMVESEHTAMSACVGASAVGARTFTATASQGLALMHEILFIASSLRMPIVMALANRAISGPISIWGDLSDVMAERDTGWLQFFCETGQDSFDQILIAYRVAEDPRVQLPVMVNIDGFTLTHVIEPIEILDLEEVKRFLPPFKPVTRLNPEKPVSLGPVGFPEIYTEAKKQQDEALRQSRAVILEAWEEFEKAFGRKYSAIETYRADEAEILLLTIGSIGGTARTAIDQLRDKGIKAGLLRLRLFRPFPFKELRDLTSGSKVLAVVDRALSLGGPGGPVFSEIRSALYPLKDKPVVAGYVAGLGGRDVTIEDFRTIIDDAVGVAEKGYTDEFKIVGVRE